MTGLPVVMSNPNASDIVEAFLFCVLRFRWNPGVQEEDRILAATITPDWAHVQALAPAARAGLRAGNGKGSDREKREAWAGYSS